MEAWMGEEALPEDVEMPLEEHLIELGRRFLFAAANIALLTFLFFPFSDTMLAMLREDLLPAGTPLIATSPVEYLYIRIQLSIVAAVLVSLPLIGYELFAFMRPGLFPNERRFYLRMVPGSIVFLFLGGIFSYYVATPFLAERALIFTASIAEPFLMLRKFADFVSSMLLLFGVIFQMPIVISTLVMLDLVTLRQLRAKRKIAYLLLAAVAVIFAPDPTPLAPLLIAVAMVMMYEVGVVFAWGFAKK